MPCKSKRGCTNNLKCTKSWHWQRERILRHNFGILPRDHFHRNFSSWIGSLSVFHPRAQAPARSANPTSAHTLWFRPSFPPSSSTHDSISNFKSAFYSLGRLFWADPPRAELADNSFAGWLGRTAASSAGAKEKYLMGFRVQTKQEETKGIGRQRRDSYILKAFPYIRREDLNIYANGMKKYRSSKLF